MSRAAKTVQGLLLMLLLLYLVFRGVDLAAIGERVARASAPGLLAGAAALLAHFPLRALRWRTLLVPVRRNLPFRPLFEATILGFAISAVVPGRPGEILRPALVASGERIPFGAAFGSILAERLIDILTVLAFFGVGILITPLSGKAAGHAAMIRGASLGLAAAVFAAALVLVAAVTARRRLEQWAARRNRWVAWLVRAVLSVGRGTDVLRRPRLLASAAGQSVLIWALIVGGNWLAVRACGADISVGAMQVIMPLLVLGVALPTPAGTGGYHAALSFGLTSLFAVDAPTAVTASIFTHLASVVPLLVLGSVLWIGSNTRWRDLAGLLRRAREQTAADERQEAEGRQTGNGV